MIYIGNRTVNRKSYEPEIDRWLKDQSRELDAVGDSFPKVEFFHLADDAFDDPDPQHAVYALLPGMFGDGDCWEEEIGRLGLGPDDLDYLTII